MGKVEAGGQERKKKRGMDLVEVEGWKGLRGRCIGGWKGLRGRCRWVVWSE